MPKASVRVGAEYPVPPAAVWSVVSDHEGTHAWVPKVKRVTLLKPGEPKNGMPALRRVEFRPALWSTIDERIVSVELPHVVELEITEADPVIKGATAKAQLKNAVLETGAALQVPSYIVAGELVRVDTRDGRFVERAKK